MNWSVRKKYSPNLKIDFVAVAILLTFHKSVGKKGKVVPVLNGITP
jgi:hypothetical protein